MFDYTNNSALANVESHLSTERLARYAAATGGDRVRTLRLYTWNTEVSSAFYGPLQALEVALRNALDLQLANFYGREWYDAPTFLRVDSEEQISKKRQKPNRVCVLSKCRLMRHTWLRA